MAEEGKNPVLCALAVAIIAVSVLAIGPVPADGAAVVPCPFSGAASTGVLSSAPPRVTNPCPGGEWGKLFGGYENATGFDVLPTADGGYAVLGEIRPPGNWDVWILKLNATGVVEWQNFYGGSGRERPHTIRQTSDGGFIVAAETQSWGGGSRDAWILKLDPQGQVQWQVAYGSSGDDAANDVWPTSDGGYIFVGLTNSAHLGRTTVSCDRDYYSCIDAWAVKLDAGGNVAWQKVYGVTKPGDSAHECFNAVRQTSDGGFIASGTRALWQSSGFVPSTWLVRLDSAGTIVWQNTYGKGSGGQLCGGFTGSNPDVVLTPDGGFVTDPVYFYGPEPTDGYAMKVDSAGKVQWRMAYGTPGVPTGREYPWEWFLSVDIAPDGGYVFAGVWEDAGLVGHPWIVRTDANGNVLWQRTFGMSVGTASALGAHLTPDGGIVLTGGWSGNGLFVMKLYASGNPGSCTDLTIGASSEAVQRNSTARGSQSQAKTATPPTGATLTTAVPSASSAWESQLCTS